MRLPLWGCRCNLIRLLLLLRCAWGTGALRELTLMPTRVYNLMYVMCLLYCQPRGNSSLCIPECWEDGHHMDIKCCSACCLRHHHVAATCLKQASCIYFSGEGFVPSKVCVCLCVVFKKKLILCHVLKEPLFLIQSRTLLKAILNVSMWSVKFSILPSFSNWILWVYLRLCFSVTAIMCVHWWNAHTSLNLQIYCKYCIYRLCVHRKEKSDHFCILVLLLYNVYKMRTLTYKNLLFCSIVDKINYCKLITRKLASNPDVLTFHSCGCWWRAGVFCEHSWLSCSERSFAQMLIVLNCSRDNQ